MLQLVNYYCSLDELCNDTLNIMITFTEINFFAVKREISPSCLRFICNNNLCVNTKSYTFMSPFYNKSMKPIFLEIIIYGF